MFDVLDSKKDMCIQALREVCERNDVRFFDMNSSQEFRNKEWLFVDRVHLTDRGYELAAAALVKEFGL